MIDNSLVHLMCIGKKFTAQMLHNIARMQCCIIRITVGYLVTSPCSVLIIMVCIHYW